MAVKVWDASAGAFKDADTPMILDEASGAYKNSTGLVYDENSSAWSERWGENKLWLYKEGNECKNVTGGWNQGYLYSTSGYSYEKRSDSIYMMASSGTDVYIETLNKIDISKYNILKLSGLFSSTGSRAGYHIGINSSPKRPIGSATVLIQNGGSGKVTTEISVDISRNKDIGYLVFALGSSSMQSSTITATISNAWLE